ncbi:CZB domain-containing protein [Salmonella enterica]|nr:hypothetical protein [Salmonella enterica]EIE5051075.1 CZB domain-containing protein [Salmonella enterica subsp. enterica serovar Java]EBR6515261.1 hypothetical protein [Salmonella enterica]EDZ9225603.1 hypothetical protein [Salmonella enterica]EEC5199534.1 hypothetical protein [Salmonella enterica]
MISGDNDALFAMVYRMLQSKQVHVLYTAEKAEKLYTRISAVADENETVTDEITGLVNRMYSLRGRLKNKLGALTPRERRYGNQVIALLNGLIEENEKIQGKMTVSANAMRCTAHSLQVTVLKAIHYQWRERVYMSVLEGKNTFPPEDEHHCVLGRWYHGEGRTDFGSLPAFVRLGDAHSRLHLALSELVKESLRAKRTPESVLKKLDALETVSQAVIVALDELDDSIIRSGVGDKTSLSEE